MNLEDVHNLHLNAYMLLKHVRSSLNSTKILLKEWRYFLQQIE